MASPRQVALPSPSLEEPPADDLLIEVEPYGEEHFESDLLAYPAGGSETMVCAANTGFSHTKIGNSPASLFDFKAALQASKEAAKKHALAQLVKRHVSLLTSRRCSRMQLGNAHAVSMRHALPVPAVTRLA